MEDSGHLSHDEFFDGLGELLNRRKGSDHGAVYLTQKRQRDDAETWKRELTSRLRSVTYNRQEREPPAAADDVSDDLVPPMPVIVRATNGKSKVKRSKKIYLLLTIIAGGAVHAIEPLHSLPIYKTTVREYMAFGRTLWADEDD
ncbi:hypothetical protein XA68_10072 [Ophiocordyceps unilateralis]|uniref:Uncharacterized protein n=1 Tax=Ophiocordyceps unilateralis TaxID=268505 RepID=A0A2A9PPU5_OPHUN|nr:hypothetical protein XA68_10072 [Ophiocordyceps unilateralis]